MEAMLINNMIVKNGRNVNIFPLRAEKKLLSADLVLTSGIFHKAHIFLRNFFILSLDNVANLWNNIAERKLVSSNYSKENAVIRPVSSDLSTIKCLLKAVIFCTMVSH